MIPKPKQATPNKPHEQRTATKGGKNRKLIQEMKRKRLEGADPAYTQENARFNGKKLVDDERHYAHGDGHSTRTRGKMSANGVPWATPNTKHSLDAGPDHPQPIFQAKKHESIRSPHAGAPKPEHTYTSENRKTIFQSPAKKRTVTVKGKAAEWWRKLMKKQERLTFA